jgi:excisionase family DNA binding protein
LFAVGVRINFDLSNQGGTTLKIFDVKPMQTHILTTEDYNRLLLANKETFTIEEFSNYSGLRKSTIYKLTSQRKIPFSCPNGKVIFISHKDADAYLQSNRVPSTYEINAAAANYVTLNPNRKGGASL